MVLVLVLAFFLIQTSPMVERAPSVESTSIIDPSVIKFPKGITF